MGKEEGSTALSVHGIYVQCRPPSTDILGGEKNNDAENFESTDYFKTDNLVNVDPEVLVEIVRLAQKQGLKGVKGGWKDFLNYHDKKFGAGLSDPAKRSTDILVAFLKTFTQEDNIKFFRKMIRRRSDHKAIEQFIKDFPDQESPQQELVRLTVEHPNYAVHYSFPSDDEEWRIVPLGKVSKAMKSKTMISVDCEMVLCKDGTEAVVKVCAVDHNLEVKLDKFVNPNKDVTDYRTEITGVSAEDLEGVTCSLVDVQKSLKKLLSHGTILVGHSLHNDLKALKIDHPRVIDTSYIFKFVDLPTTYAPSLNNLCKSLLGFEVRKVGEPHNCLNDAQATMKLVLAKLDPSHVDHPIAIAGKSVPDSDLAKLFLHNIPVDIPCQELLKLFSADHNIEIQSDVRNRGKSYSTFAVFKDAIEADEAFRRVEGQENKDSSGRLQKLVSLKLSPGNTSTFYVRRMTRDDSLANSETSKKRPAQDETEDLQDETGDLKRQRFYLRECDHVQEIGKLREELRLREEEKNSMQKVLSARDEEIFNLQKILSALTRKHGL